MLTIAAMPVLLKIGSAVESPQMVRKCALPMDRLPLLYGRLIPPAAAPLCVGLALLVVPMIEKSSCAMDLVWEALAAWSISAARRNVRSTCPHNDEVVIIDSSFEIYQGPHAISDQGHTLLEWF